MIWCLKFKRSLYQLAEGTLDENKVRALRAHLERCPGCRKEYRQIAGLLDLAAKARPKEMDDAFWARFDRELDERLSTENAPAYEIKFKPSFDPWVIPKPVYAFASAAVLLLVISFVVLGGLPTPGRIVGYQDQRLAEEVQMLEEISGEFIAIDEEDALFYTLYPRNGVS